MKFNNAILGLFVILIGAYAWFESASYPPGISGGYGSAFFPRVVGAAMLFLGSLLVLGGMRERRTVGWVQLSGWARGPRPLTGVAVLVGALVFLTLTMKILGFPIAAFIAAFAFMTYLRGRPLTSCAYSAATVLVIHFAFSEVFSVILPLGILDTLIR